MTVCLNMLDASPVIPYLCIVCVLGYIVGFAIGPGPVPWIWNSEFFNQRARGPAGCKFYSLSDQGFTDENRAVGRLVDQADRGSLTKIFSGLRNRYSK